MNVTLLVPPILRADGSHVPVPCPFPGWGIALLGAALRAGGHRARVVDLSGDDEAALRVHLADLDADLFGVAVFSEAARGAACLIKQLALTHPGVGVVVGGLHPTWEWKSWFRFANVVAVVRGEGETALAGIADDIAAGRAVGAGPGRVVRGPEGLVDGGRGQADAPPVHDHLHLSDVCFRVGDYGARLHPDSPGRRAQWIEACGGADARAIAIHTTRGCLYRCRFCSFEVSEGLREMPLEWVYELLERVHQRGVRTLLVYDAVFLARPERAAALAEEMVRRGWGFRWTAQTVARHRPATLELIPLLARAGLVAMAIGLESASDAIRKTMAKDRVDVPVQDVLAAYRASGVQAFVNVMVGSPAEDDASVADTCRLLHAVPPDDVGGAKRVRLYPGSAWLHLAVEQGIVSENHDWEEGVPEGVFHTPERLALWESRIDRHRELSAALDGLRPLPTRVRVGLPPHPDTRALDDALAFRLGSAEEEETGPTGPFPPACTVVVYQSRALAEVVAALRGREDAQIVAVDLVGCRYVLRLAAMQDAPPPRVADLYASWQALHTALSDAPSATRGRIPAIDQGLRTSASAVRPALPLPPRPPGGWRRPIPGDLQNRILGAWLGRAAGNRLGIPCENLSRAEIRHACAALGMAGLDGYWQRDPKPTLGPDALHYRTTPRRRFLAGSRGIGADDDLAFTVLGLGILEEHGRWPDTAAIAGAWVAHLPYACTAEWFALERLRAGVLPLEAADGEHPYAEWVGAMIRVDPWAWAHPGAPGDAAAVAWGDAVLTHRGEGVHAAVFVAGMMSAAFTAATAADAIAAGLALVPPGSGVALAVRAAARACGADPSTAVDAALHWGDGLSTGHALRNLPLIVTGLLLGRDELGPTLSRVVGAGEDTDSNAAIAGSVVGALRGAAALPDDWVTPLDGPIESFLVGNSSLAGAALTSAELARRFTSLVTSPGEQPCASPS